ncbi:hypothetical protein ACFQ29_24225 [Longispora fulva]|uniref:Terminase small subunit n=1 Tax=Longispora fulva TaxID=619741 RepID=A0A8J7GJ76_9ACTN|nr:hypothetical protein [Longispora fulva]MBG6137513.1 hypothetical protein [Longispora fulva]
MGRYTSPLDKPEDIQGTTTNAPTLPTPNKWLAATARWWDTWVSSPQAAVFAGTDWQRLLMLLPLVDGYNRAVHKLDYMLADRLLTQIVRSESLLGATHVDRLRGRIKVQPEETPEPQPDLSALARDFFGD